MTPANYVGSNQADRLQTLKQIFAKAALGDFSQDVELPDKDDKFAELYIGVQIMLNVIREKIAALESINTAMQQQIQEKSSLLEKLEAEKMNLAEVKSKTDAILSSIGEGMIAIDKQGHMLLINNTAQHLLGIRPDNKMIGHSILRAIPLRRADGSVIPFKQRPLHQALTTGRTIVSDTAYYYTRADGSAFPVAFTATPVKRQEKVIGAIIVFRDISHEMEVDSAKTEFVFLASHQLRTPLTMINWHVERLLGGKVGELTEPQTKSLQEVAQGGKRMAALVQSLLNVSRIELGTFVLEPELTDIHDSIQNVLQELQPMIKLRELHIIEQYSNQVPRVIIDPKVLYTVLQNILNNAVKYTPAGGTVNIKVSPESQKKRTTHPPDNILLRITDTGLGIPRRQQKKIFNKLFRADNVKELDTEGSGLGLYIAKSMLTYAGGKIWFTSTEGQGTSFCVLLPLTKSLTSSIPLRTRMV